MKKFLKVAIALGLLVALVMGVASIVLHVLLPPEKAKALVLKQLAGHLHRQVSLGTVSVSVLSGVHLSDLKVSESPDFSKGTFVSSDEFSLKVALTPLLFRKVVVQVGLRHPEVTVVRSADGKTFNFSDLTGSPTTQASAQRTASGQPAESPSFNLLVSRAEIDNGVIHFIDHSPAQQSVEINPLSLKLKNVSLTATFGVQTSLIAQVKARALHFDLNGQANVLKGDFTMKSCELSSEGSTLRVSGRASELKTNHPAADLKIDLDPFDPGILKPWVVLPADVHWVGPLAAHAHVKGDAKQLTVNGQADLTKVQLSYGKQFSKPAKVPFTAVITGTLDRMQNLQLENLQAVLGALKIAMHGSVDGVTSDEPSVNLHVVTNSMPMHELNQYIAAALPPTLSLTGTSQLSADISGTLSSCRVAAKWQGDALAATMGDTLSKPAGVPLDVSLIGELLRPPSKGPAIQTVNIQTLSGTFGPVQWNGSGSYKTVGTKSDLNLAIKTNAWSLSEMAHLVPMLEAYHPSGHVTVDARASGSLDAPAVTGALVLNDAGGRYQQSDITALAGTVNFTQQDVNAPKLAGKLNGSDFTIQLAGHHLQTQPDVHMDAAFTEVDLNKLLPPVGATPPTASIFSVTPAEAATPSGGIASLPMKLSGHLTVSKLVHPSYQAQSLDAKWNLTNVTPDLAHVGGTATMRQGSGHLNNLEKLAEQVKSLRVVLQPVIVLQKLDANGSLKALGIPTLQDIPFDGIRGDYTFQNGVMDVKEFNLDGKTLALQSQGTIGLTGDNSLNLMNTIKFPAGSGGLIGNALRDADGRPTIKFSLTGPARNAKPHPELGEVSQRLLQGAGQQLLKNLGIGGSAQPPPPNPDGSSPPPQNAPNPAADLQKALKNIFH